MRKRIVLLVAVLTALGFGRGLSAQTLPKPYIDYDGPGGPGAPAGGAACDCPNPGGITFTTVTPAFIPNKLSPTGSQYYAGGSYGATAATIQAGSAAGGATVNGPGPGATPANATQSGTVTRAGQVENKWLSDGQLMCQYAPPRVDQIFLPEDCRCVDPDFCPKPPPSFPPISVELDVLALRRTQPDYSVLNNTLGFTQTDVNDLDYAAGPRVRVDIRGIDQYDIEGVFYRIDSWSGSETYTRVGGLPGIGDYDSRLFNGELNLRRTWPERPWLTGMVGMRYIENTDRLTYNSAIPIGNTLTRLDANNKLYGGQIGVDVLLWQATETFAISAFGKGGLFFNAATHTQTSVVAGNTAIASDHFDPTSALGEAALCFTWRPHRQIAVRGGYEYLIISGLAQPSDAILFSEESHSVTYNGGFLGFELSW